MERPPRFRADLPQQSGDRCQGRGAHQDPTRQQAQALRRHFEEDEAAEEGNRCVTSYLYLNLLQLAKNVNNVYILNVINSCFDC